MQWVEREREKDVEKEKERPVGCRSEAELDFNVDKFIQSF